MERRNFLKISASATAVAVSPSLIADKLKTEDGKALFKAFEKVQLKDGEGKPLKSANLIKEENYTFMYP